MNGKDQIQKGINWLELLLSNYDDIWKIVTLVQDNPDFFDCRIGGSTLEAAGRYIENQINKVNNKA